jgi:hypothetical protein
LVLHLPPLPCVLHHPHQKVRLAHLPNCILFIVCFLVSWSCNHTTMQIGCF